MTVKKASVEAGGEGAVPGESELAPQEAEKTRHRYQGPGSRTYPHHRNPETGYTLTAESGDVFDFSPNSPPADGYWYDTGSGLPYAGADESPAENAAGQEEGS